MSANKLLFCTVVLKITYVVFFHKQDKLFYIDTRIVSEIRIVIVFNF